MAKRSPSDRRVRARRDRQRRHENTAALAAIKEQTPCADCGGRFPACAMDFDHRDSSTKRAQVSNLVNNTWSVIAAEIAKCDVVCATCHRIRSHQRGQHIQVKRRPSSQLDLLQPSDHPPRATPAPTPG